MAEQLPRSPYDALNGLVYFPRMLDKIRLHAAGKLPPLYLKPLGQDFDGRCLRFLGVKYDDVKKLVLAGKSDAEVFDWCVVNGHKLTEEQIETWNGFMTKRGWRDEASRSDCFPAEGIGHRESRQGSGDDVRLHRDRRGPYAARFPQMGTAAD